MTGYKEALLKWSLKLTKTFLKKSLFLEDFSSHESPKTFSLVRYTGFGKYRSRVGLGCPPIPNIVRSSVIGCPMEVEDCPSSIKKGTSTVRKDRR